LVFDHFFLSFFLSCLSLSFPFFTLAQATNVGGQTGFASPLNPRGTKGPAQTPKSADALSHAAFTIILSFSQAPHVCRHVNSSQDPFFPYSLFNRTRKTGWESHQYSTRSDSIIWMSPVMTYASLEHKSSLNVSASINEVTFGEQVSAICSESKRVIGSKVVDEEESVLHLRSPEQQKPVPRQWNVESPLVQKLRSKKRF
ncbi:hypothetical protein cypCar_00026272, partial [Cyprinus carpio]